MTEPDDRLDALADAVERFLESCPDCGKPADSFACKVRHVGISIGWGRAANE